MEKIDSEDKTQEIVSLEIDASTGVQGEIISNTEDGVAKIFSPPKKSSGVPNPHSVSRSIPPKQIGGNNVIEDIFRNGTRHNIKGSGPTETTELPIEKKVEKFIQIMKESSDPQVCADAKKMAEELNNKYELGFEIPNIPESNFYTASLVPPMKDPFLTGQINTTIKKSPPPKYTKKEEIDPSSIEYIIERLTEIGRNTFKQEELEKITDMLLVIREHLVPSLEIPDLSMYMPFPKKSLTKTAPINLDIIMANIERKIEEKNGSK